jgi:phytoene synthase
MNSVSLSSSLITEQPQTLPAPADYREIIHHQSRSFSTASRLLPKQQRTDVQRLYAWCRWCDDAVDCAPNRAKAVEQLNCLRDDVERIYRGEKPQHPASDWFADLVGKYPIERELPLGLIKGMEMDLSLVQLATDDELQAYCYHAAGVVGLMMCRIFGVIDPRADEHAASLGIAMQLTNIARDVKEDWERGRCYLPESFLGSADDVAMTNAGVRSAVERILKLADTHYSKGRAGIHFLPPAARRSVRIAAAVYREIGLEIRRKDFVVMDGRTIVPKHRFIVAALRSLSGGMIQDARSFLGAFIDNRDFSTSNSFGAPTMNDAKYIAYLGLSLTSFMASTLFLLMMFNPKDASYATLPLLYAGICFVVGIGTNIMARRVVAAAAD